MAKDAVITAAEAALRAAGIAPHEVLTRPDRELLAVPGVGRKMVARLRELYREEGETALSCLVDALRAEHEAGAGGYGGLSLEAAQALLVRLKALP